jgi:AAA domain
MIRRSMGTTVAQVLAAPDAFVGRTLSDPFEGPDYGTGKAIVYRRADDSLFINSFAHGGMIYELKVAADTKTDSRNLVEWDAGEDPGPIPPRQWLLANQFCCGFISSIVSAGAGGKSSVRILQFISLALGRSLCGQHVFRRCRVLLLSLEDDRDELQRRIEACSCTTALIAGTLRDGCSAQRRSLPSWPK